MEGGAVVEPGGGELVIQAVQVDRVRRRPAARRRRPSPGLRLAVVLPGVAVPVAWQVHGACGRVGAVRLGVDGDGAVAVGVAEVRR